MTTQTRCSVIGCRQTATHILRWRAMSLDGSMPLDDWEQEPVCKEDGEIFARRPTMQGYLRPIFSVTPRVELVNNEHTKLWDRTINGARYRFVSTPEHLFVLRNPGKEQVIVHMWREGE